MVKHLNLLLSTVFVLVAQPFRTLSSRNKPRIKSWVQTIHQSIDDWLLVQCVSINTCSQARGFETLRERFNEWCYMVQCQRKELAIVAKSWIFSTFRETRVSQRKLTQVRDMEGCNVSRNLSRNAVARQVSQIVASCNRSFRNSVCDLGNTGTPIRRLKPIEMPAEEAMTEVRELMSKWTTRSKIV